MPHLRILSPRFFVLIIFTNQIVSANDISSSTLSFQNSSIHFSTTKSSTDFSFSDSFGERNLKIQKCNKKIIDDFWMKMINIVNNIKASNIKDRQLSNSITWIKYEGVQFPILSFDPALHFFNGVPSDSHVLFSESKRLCRKK